VERRLDQRGQADAGVRTLPSGPDQQGLITYLILEDQRRVDILDVLWIG